MAGAILTGKICGTTDVLDEVEDNPVFPLKLNGFKSDVGPITVLVFGIYPTAEGPLARTISGEVGLEEFICRTGFVNIPVTFVHVVGVL